MFRGLQLILVLSLVAIATSAALADHKYRIVIIPKLVGISYYAAAKKGIDEAARELPEVNVSWIGPTQDRVEKQIAILDKIIPTRPDMIAIAPNDRVAIAPALEKAKREGIRILNWAGETDLHDLVVNPVDCRTFGVQIVEALEEEVGPKGEIAIVTPSFAAPNQLRWIEEIKRHIYSKYPDLTIYDIRTAGANTEEAYRITRDYLHEIPGLKGIIALGVLVAPGVAKAVEDAGLSGKVAVVGVSTPDLMRPYVKDGTVKKVLLWKAEDHGYLTVYSAYRLLTTGVQLNQPFKAGRLGTFTPQMDGLNMQVFLPTLVLTKANIDEYHF